MDRLLFRVDVVPHDEQRYETTGDWQFLERAKQDEWLHVSVSDMGNDDYAFLVGRHEIMEAWLCRKAGISEQDVTAFDESYEEARENCEVAPCGCVPTRISEPGDDIHAPYFAQHQLATHLEKQEAEMLGVEWDAYERANLALYEKDDHEAAS